MPPSFEAGPNRKGEEENEELSSMSIHNEGLHDQDEDAAGEKTNLATGEAFDNSTHTGMEDLQVIEGGRGSKDVLGRIPKEKNIDDAKKDLDADEWLRNNDPDYKKAA